MAILGNMKREDEEQKLLNAWRMSQRPKSIAARLPDAPREQYGTRPQNMQVPRPVVPVENPLTAAARPAFQTRPQNLQAFGPGAPTQNPLTAAARPALGAVGNLNAAPFSNAPLGTGDAPDLMRPAWQKGNPVASMGRNRRL